MNKRIIGLVMTASMSLGAAVVIAASANKSSFYVANAERTIYTLSLTEVNAPTTSLDYQRNVETSISAQDGAYELGFVYSKVKAAVGYHAVLANGATIKRTGDNATKGFNGISAHYQGGKLFLKYGASAERLHVREIPNDGTLLTLPEDYTFTHFEIEAVGETSILDMTIKYDCYVDENPNVGATTITSGEAIVSGIRSEYPYGEKQYFHVKPKGTGYITEVSLNGYELEPETTLGEGFYSYYPAPNDQLVIRTSVDEVPNVTVGTYYIDDTGTTQPIGTGSYVIPSTSVDYSDEWAVKITAPSIEGYTTADGYYPNQDYVKFEKGTTPTINFYYSKLSTYDASATTTSLLGAGTESNPYLITSVADWLYFIGNASTADKSFYKLTKSLDLSGLPATTKQFYGARPLKPANSANAPILETDTNAVYFSGTFDGNNCAIRGISSGVTSNIPSSQQYALGIFAVVNVDATVKNLALYGKMISKTSHSRAGAFAGYNLGTIQNCINYVHVQRNENNGGTGGIVGDLNGTGAAKVDGCVNYGLVEVSGNYVANIAMGGIVGYITNDVKATSVTNCINFGNVENKGVYTGGIVGRNNIVVTNKSTIDNCDNFGDLSSSKASIGGIVCLLGSNICKNSNNFGDITALEAVTNDGIGGIAYTSGAGLIENCNNFGSLLKSDATDSTKDQGSVGGILGLLYTTTVKNSNNFGSIRYVGTANYIGGITAWFRDAGTRTVTNCGNFGDINTTGDEVGGLAGYCSNVATVIVNVDGFINVGTIVSNSYVGAFVGNTKIAAFTILNSTNLGKASTADLIHNGYFGDKGASTVVENCNDYMM